MDFAEKDAAQVIVVRQETHAPTGSGSSAPAVEGVSSGTAAAMAAISPNSCRPVIKGILKEIRSCSSIAGEVSEVLKTSLPPVKEEAGVSSDVIGTSLPPIKTRRG